MSRAPFVTRAELQARHPRELAVLAADEKTREIDTVRVDNACLDASVEIRGILASRYTPDDLERVDAESAAVLRLYAIDITLYRVSASFGRSSETIEKRYLAAIARLRDMAAGKGALTVTPAGGPAAAEGPATSGSPNEVVIAAPERLFTRRRFRGRGMSIGLSVTVGDFAAANALIARFAELDEYALLETIGTIGESQTRRRIEEEKTGPDGEAWPPNAEGTSILLRTGGHLRDSLAFEVGAGEVHWGSSWEFAHVHQDGAVISAKGRALSFLIRGRRRAAKRVTIPARPFVGLSAENGREIEQVTIEWLSGLAR